MPSGGHRHLKRLNAPDSWGLEKSGGKFAVRPLPGAHSKQLSIPLKYIIARFLKVAKTSKEVRYILKSNMVQVNNKDITIQKATAGLFDVITIKKTNQHYRLIFNINRRFKVHKITSDESKYRITKVMNKETVNGIPYTRTLDGYNFKFVDPAVNIGDTVKIDIGSNKVIEYLRFETGHIAFVFSGSNRGRVGSIKRIEKLKNGSSFVYLEDANGKSFTVLDSKVMVIGNKESLWITLDEDQGKKLDVFELSNLRYKNTEEIEATDK